MYKKLTAFWMLLSSRQVNNRTSTALQWRIYCSCSINGTSLVCLVRWWGQRSKCTPQFRAYLPCHGSGLLNWILWRSRDCICIEHFSSSFSARPYWYIDLFWQMSQNTNFSHLQNSSHPHKIPPFVPDLLCSLTPWLLYYACFLVFVIVEHIQPSLKIFKGR